ncbi:serine protease inhibitor dipetalogastin-like isoform X1 [Spodoptera frugiperda]|uniref:Serine protease inhibitor dipetalogastin-like isoform X1 n=1 Tax=Spodoptera frugiperda TaxID=7108 RepID=A0A9R0DIP1_SPOFR|nr:serine protease inhibitor dipetalogastin-like isoform X1 [Spodoptera frugiperda]
MVLIYFAKRMSLNAVLLYIAKMEKIYKIFIHSIIVIITCGALSQLVPHNTVPFMARPWSAAQSKALRQGKGGFCCAWKEPDYHDDDSVARVVGEGDTVVGSMGGLIMLRTRVGASEVNHRSEHTEEPPRRDCFCSKIYDPVCASNNESYFNLCFLECKVPKSDNISVIHQGNCIPF